MTENPTKNKRAGSIFLKGSSPWTINAATIIVITGKTEKNLVLRPIIIKAGAINSEKVAKAMIKIANENLKKTILESDEIVEISSG